MINLMVGICSYFHSIELSEQDFFKAIKENKCFLNLKKFIRFLFADAYISRAQTVTKLDRCF